MAEKEIDKIGKYTIIEMLGKGAMGVVYKALDPDIGREVAVKTIRFDIVDGDDEEMMGRFIREAQAAGKLDHANITTIYDVGREKDLTYIVMQYIKGQSLQQLIAKKKKFSPKEINDIMIPLCEALEYAHQHGIVHRDIKPANILIDLNGKPKVVDFGVARIETSTLTQSGVTVGTPSYMSPEQIMGKRVDNRADIFSLGVILYELAAGQRPFSGGNVSTLMYKIVNEEPPHITEVDKSLPAKYENIVEKALAKDPKDRFKSCLQFMAALKGESGEIDSTIAYNFDQDQTIRIDKPEKKNRGLILGISIAAAALIGFAGIYFFVIKPRDKPSEQTQLKTQANAQMKTEESAAETKPPTIPVEPPIEETAAPDSFEERLSQLKTVFDGGQFDEAIKLGETIIEEDSENAAAKDFVKRAKQKKEDIRLASNAIIISQIKEIIEHQRQAEEAKDLLLLLNDIGAKDFSERRREAATFMINNFEDIKSANSNISVKITDAKHAEARFSFLLSGVSKTTKQRGIIEEGEKTWLFEKQGNTWKIVGRK
ncbi:MAG: protein kinase [Candidatus Aminicenantes bacterium]|nr:protein kinase [Candidatus Aminicenantes bacterium]